MKKETFEVKKKLEMGQLEVSSQRPSASIYNDRRSSWDLIHLITY